MIKTSKSSQSVTATGLRTDFLHDSAKKDNKGKQAPGATRPHERAHSPLSPGECDMVAATVADRLHQPDEPIQAPARTGYTSLILGTADMLPQGNQQPTFLLRSDTVPNGATPASAKGKNMHFISRDEEHFSDGAIVSQETSYSEQHGYPGDRSADHGKIDPDTNAVPLLVTSSIASSSHGNILEHSGHSMMTRSKRGMVKNTDAEHLLLQHQQEILLKRKKFSPALVSETPSSTRPKRRLNRHEEPPPPPVQTSYPVNYDGEVLDTDEDAVDGDHESSAMLPTVLFSQTPRTPQRNNFSTEMLTHRTNSSVQQGNNFSTEVLTHRTISSVQQLLERVGNLENNVRHMVDMSTDIVNINTDVHKLGQQHTDLVQHLRGLQHTVDSIDKLKTVLKDLSSLDKQSINIQKQLDNVRESVDILQDNVKNNYANTPQLVQTELRRLLQQTQQEVRETLSAELIKFNEVQMHQFEQLQHGLHAHMTQLPQSASDSSEALQSILQASASFKSQLEHVQQELHQISTSFHEQKAHILKLEREIPPLLMLTRLTGLLLDMSNRITGNLRNMCKLSFLNKKIRLHYLSSMNCNNTRNFLCNPCRKNGLY